jgi:hypothetical protein
MKKILLATALALAANAASAATIDLQKNSDNDVTWRAVSNFERMQSDEQKVDAWLFGSGANLFVGQYFKYGADWSTNAGGFEAKAQELGLDIIASGLACGEPYTGTLATMFTEEFRENFYYDDVTRALLGFSLVWNDGFGSCDELKKNVAHAERMSARVEKQRESITDANWFQVIYLYPTYVTQNIFYSIFD